jgi:glucose/galactose transporter
MKTKNYYLPLGIIASIFFAFGFILWLNGILIPYFKIFMELTNFQASLVVFAFYIAFFVMAIPSAWILKSTGYKKGMGLGLVVMAIGTFLFIPAAYTRIYGIFLSGLFITGTGLTLVQAAANPYVAIIGPIESTAQRVGFLGLANKTAGIFSILVLSSIFLVDADGIIAKAGIASLEEKNSMFDVYALKIITPYILISSILLLLAVLVFFSKLPEINEEKLSNSGTEDEIIPRTSIFQYPWLILGVITMFFASSCEIIPIDGIILYSRSLGISIEESRHFPVYTLVLMLLGYLASIILIPKYLTQQKALLLCSIWGISMSVGAYFSNGITSVYFLILTGFATAMFWGTIWGLSLRGLGKFTKFGGAMLLMGVIGGAVFPVVFGKLLDFNTQFPQNATLILIPLYLVLSAFSKWGYKLENWSFVPSKKD